MPLRVLHINTERGWRGGERQTLWLAAELARRGYRSVVAARRGEPLAMRGSRDGLDMVDCSPSSEIDPLAAWRLRREIVARRIDVVHAHAAHAAAAAAAATIGLRVPLVVSRRVDVGLRPNIGTRLKYGRAAVLIAISDAVARVLESSGIEAERIRIVPDGVDMHRVVEPATRATLASLGVRDGAPLVAQVGQLAGSKDPVNFVRAMAVVRERVPGAEALLVGDGPLAAEVRSAIHSLGLQRVVHMAGYRTDADELLAASDVASLSSRVEGMGSVLLDAMAFGRAVAATRAGGIPEVVADGETGLLVPPGDPAALGDAIARLLADAPLRARLGENGRRRAADFSVERMTDRTLEVYDEVLNGLGGGRRSCTEPASSLTSASVMRAP